MGRIASIDYGLARIGLAVSDELKIIASSIATVAAEKKSQESLKKVLLALAPYQLEAIIIGIPYKMNGQMSFLADEVTHFVELMKQELSCPVVLWDERLSTVQAERSLKEANMSRKKRSKVIDAVTATLLLQSYLDMLHIKANNASIYR